MLSLFPSTPLWADQMPQFSLPVTKLLAFLSASLCRLDFTGETTGCAFCLLNGAESNRKCWEVDADGYRNQAEQKDNTWTHLTSVEIYNLVSC